MKNKPSIDSKVSQSDNPQSGSKTLRSMFGNKVIPLTSPHSELSLVDHPLECAKSNGCMSPHDIKAIYSLAPHSNTNSLYNELTSPKTFRRQLLSIGSQSCSAKGPINTRMPRELAIIKIQSYWRMCMVVLASKKKESDRVAIRHQILEDCLARKGDWPKFIENQKKYFYLFGNNLSKDIYSLVKYFYSENVKEKEEQTVLKFFFNCFCVNNSEFLTATSIKKLLTGILCLSIPGEDIDGINGVFCQTPYNNHVDYLQFYNWFMNYKKVSKLKPMKWELKISRVFGFNIDEIFVINFLRSKSACYDSIIQLKKYDELNPSEVKCPICSKKGRNIRHLLKHAGRCRRRKDLNLTKIFSKEMT